MCFETVWTNRICSWVWELMTDIQIFGLSYQENGAAIHLHEEDYMREQQA